METTYRRRCGVGRSRSLSRCLDPAWTSCTAIFKSAREPGGRQRPRGGGTEHTGQTVLLPWKYETICVWKENKRCVEETHLTVSQTASSSESWLIWALFEWLNEPSSADVGWIDCPRCTLKDRVLLQQNDNHHLCHCLYPKQGVMWRRQILFARRHEVQLRLQRSSCLKRLPICRPSVGWKWFLCVRWTLNGVAEMQSTPLWS